MRKTLALLALSAILPLNAHAQQAPPMTPAPIVFFDIAGPADAKLADFYRDVFGWQSGPMGNLSVPVNGPPLDGTFRVDPTEKVIYIGVPDITATLAQVVAKGGKVHAPRFEVKGVVILGLFFDPAGNRMGLVEMGPDGKNKVP
jgi:predicted enzyme related to lactoylglutathione lyase